MFGDFCRQSLCMESWDFIMDAVACKARYGFSVNQALEAIVFITDVSADEKYEHNKVAPEWRRSIYQHPVGVLRLIPAWKHFD